MTPQSVGDWIAWAGLVLPLATLAFSAVWFVANGAEKAKAERYTRFFELMRQAGAPDGNIASKMAAFFELQRFPEYADVIIQLCEEVEIVGGKGPVEMLNRRMHLTAQALKK